MGHALVERGIYHGDVLVANAAAEPKAGEVCVAILQGQVILATLGYNHGGCARPRKTRCRSMMKQKSGPSLKP